LGNKAVNTGDLPVVQNGVIFGGKHQISQTCGNWAKKIEPEGSIWLVQLRPVVPAIFKE
jgi:hypothetical protein